MFWVEWWEMRIEVGRCVPLVLRVDALLPPCGLPPGKLRASKRNLEFPLNVAHATCAQIKVKTLTGKEIEIDIEGDDTVSRIKERVEEKEGIPPPQQRLIFGGKQMADDKKASDYNVEGCAGAH